MTHYLIVSGPPDSTYETFDADSHDPKVSDDAAARAMFGARVRAGKRSIPIPGRLLNGATGNAVASWRTEQDLRTVFP